VVVAVGERMAMDDLEEHRLGTPHGQS
jgi:hypothetical protein